jgi:hypothetical protein
MLHAGLSQPTPAQDTAIDLTALQAQPSQNLLHHLRNQLAAPDLVTGLTLLAQPEIGPNGSLSLRRDPTTRTPDSIQNQYQLIRERIRMRAFPGTPRFVASFL